MRRAEWPLATDLAAAELARDRGDHRYFQRLAWLQRREDARKTCGEQRLARARGTAHQQIMAARGGDFERALGDFLSLDLGKIGPAVRRLGLGQQWHRTQACALQVREQRQEVGRSDHGELPCPAGFAALRGGTDQTLVLR